MEFDKYVPKGWGYERWVANGELYCGKVLRFVKGRKCSLHYHKLKTETFYVVCGKILIKYGSSSGIEQYIYKGGEVALIKSGQLEEKTLEAGDYFHVCPGLAHQIFALYDSEIIEFSTQHFENDSYRIIKGD